jgi:glucose/mannose-6-phosphate isomerase
MYKIGCSYIAGIIFKRRYEISMNMKEVPDTIDLQDMGNLVSHFPDMLNWFTPDDDILETCKGYHEEGIGGVCFIGMGGSSIVGQYMRELFSRHTPIPINIVRDYQLPRFVSKEWAVIAVSYSGNTAETLSSLEFAKNRNSKIITVTSGGQMQDLYKQYPHLLIHQGLQPRAAFPLLLAGILPIVETLLGTKHVSMNQVANDLKSASREWGKQIPQPASLAKTLFNKVPVFIGSGYMKPVAYRAKCQTNENAKAVAFYSEVPEAAHNEIEGFGSSMGGDFVPLFLRSRDEDALIAEKQDVMIDLYNESGLNPISLRAVWDSQIVNMLSMTHYLDTVSVELASLRGVNALAVKRIAELKKRLS